LQYWLDKGYDNSSAEKMRMSRTPGTIEYFIIFKKMSPECAIEAKKKYQDTRKNTYENFIIRHGEIDGEVKWQIYKDMQAYSNSYEYKKDKYGWSLDEYEKFNKNRGTTGIDNGNYGTSYYQVWVDKFGKEVADDMNEKTTQLKANFGSDNGNYKRPKRPEEIERMRKSAIKRVIRQGTCVAYNKSSIPIIEQYGNDNGYKFQHAENGGEYQIPGTTFFVDGYDKEKNVVLEYDEQYHMDTKQQIKDLERQQIIIEILKCKFIRINNKNIDTIYEN